MSDPSTVTEPLNVRTLSWRVARVGGVLRSLLMFVCGAVLLASAALLLEPQKLTAVTPPDQSSDRALRTHHEFAGTLAGLIEDGVEVLTINNHQADAAASIVVWMSDTENHGVIDPREIAVISHSQLLQTITVYTLSSTTLPISSQATNPKALRLSGPLDRVAVSAPVFCDRWRATPSVQPRTIAMGISDMRVESTGESQNGLSVLRLRLRWSPDSADGAGEASAVFASAAPAP